MKNNIYVYILIMSAVTLAIRILPLTLIRKQIKNRFIRSFLYYVPYTTLAVMTFPAIIHATKSPWTGAIAMILGIIGAWCKAGLFAVAILCCLTVFILEFFL